MPGAVRSSSCPAGTVQGRSAGVLTATRTTTAPAGSPPGSSAARVGWAASWSEGEVGAQDRRQAGDRGRRRRGQPVGARPAPGQRLQPAGQAEHARRRAARRRGRPGLRQPPRRRAPSALRPVMPGPPLPDRVAGLRGRGDRAVRAEPDRQLRQAGTAAQRGQPRVGSGVPDPAKMPARPARVPPKKCAKVEVSDASWSASVTRRASHEVSAPTGSATSPASDSAGGSALAGIPAGQVGEVGQPAARHCSRRARRSALRPTPRPRARHARCPLASMVGSASGMRVAASVDARFGARKSTAMPASATSQRAGR